MQSPISDGGRSLERPKMARSIWGNSLAESACQCSGQALSLICNDEALVYGSVRERGEERTQGTHGGALSRAGINSILQRADGKILGHTARATLVE